MPETPLSIPPGLVSVRIDPKTGLLAPENDPNGQFETFRQATVPTQYANTPAATATTQTNHTINNDDAKRKAVASNNTQTPLF